jgi:uncharacterized membrane protein
MATPRSAARAFPEQSLHAIEAAVKESELTHSGEIRFAVEPALEIGALLKGQSARDRAMEVFSALRVWDTEQNNGVLIYLLLADRDVEIVADRGIHARVGAETWEAVCRRMESAFRAGRMEQGVLEGIREVGAVLALHFPNEGPNANELPDRPVML